MGNVVLKDFDKLIKDTKENVNNNQDLINKEVFISRNFKAALAKWWENSGGKNVKKKRIEFTKCGFVMVNGDGQFTYAPNQTLVLASYAVDIFKEFTLFRDLSNAILDYEEMLQYQASKTANSGKEPDHLEKLKKVYAKLQKKDDPQLKETFEKSAREYMVENQFDENVIDNNVKLLYDFVSQKRGKSPERPDSGDSVILDALNVVNANSGYIAGIVGAYVTEKTLADELPSMVSWDYEPFVSPRTQEKRFEVFLRDLKLPVAAEDYPSGMRSLYNDYYLPSGGYKGYYDIFQIQQADELVEFMKDAETRIKNDDRKRNNGSSGLKKYLEFLTSINEKTDKTEQGGQVFKTESDQKKQHIDSSEQKELFVKWMKKNCGFDQPSTTTDKYKRYPEPAFQHFKKEIKKYENYDSVYDIQDPDVFLDYKENYLYKLPGFKEYNTTGSGHNRYASKSLNYYYEFLLAQNKGNFICDDTFITGYTVTEDGNGTNNFSNNRIFFGAPGTGKSYQLNEDRESLLGIGNETNYERVTFHPDYSYAGFVGTYKPVPCKDKDYNDAITYKYVPGPFMRTYVKAIKNAINAQKFTEKAKPYLLIVEEINRADVAAVFGDVFQLLDRDEDNISQYPIETSDDMRKYLSEELDVDVKECGKIKIPDNMFIWATMNSADQGVFPMDTAFKRRWDFEYIGIDDAVENEKKNGVKDGIGNLVINLKLSGKEEPVQTFKWNDLRHAINDFLANNNINEDKQLGPYFISRKTLESKTKIDDIEYNIAFQNAFKDKVIMYLYEDAAKQKRNDLFGSGIRYSEICHDFDKNGIDIFKNGLGNDVIENIKTGKSGNN